MGAVDTTMPSEWASLGIVPAKSLRMFGMRRSGNHAISAWLRRNAPHGRSVFLNNCRPARSPLEHFAAIEVNGALANAGDALNNLPAQTAAAAPDAMFLVSYEDVSPAEFSGNRRPSGSFDANLFDRDILIYRGFMNWAASLLKKLQKNTNYAFTRRVAIVLRTTERYTRLLRLLGQKDEFNVTGINYDSWFTSEHYRADLLQELGLPKVDNSTGKVQHYGGGSSFQKDVKTACELQTNERWQLMVNDPAYLSILHVAARDAALLEQLDIHFPDDAERLRAIASHSLLPRGGL